MIFIDNLKLSKFNKFEIRISYLYSYIHPRNNCIYIPDIVLKGLEMTCFQMLRYPFLHSTGKIARQLITEICLFSISSLL